MHQFRVVAEKNIAGLPTPEDVNRDGHKFVSMHLIERKNIEGGVSSIYNDAGRKTADYIMKNSLDTLFVADEFVKHGVTPIHAQDPNQIAYRDILVIDYNV